jgi:hypothetical protein
MILQNKVALWDVAGLLCTSPQITSGPTAIIRWSTCGKRLAWVEAARNRRSFGGGFPR